MPAGTIALTNNSAAVTGTGTSFTSELKANDFVVVVIGGVTYTLGVKSVESATALTLITAYGGATTSGLSWTPVPNATLVGITAQVAADVAKAIRGLNLDKANWQQVFTGTGNITVNLPDSTSFTGPAWGGIANSLNNKANLVNDVVEVSHGGTGQKTLSGVMTWLGLGDAAFKNTGTTSGTLAAGNDARLLTVAGKTGGLVTTPLFAQDAVAAQRLLNVGNNTFLGGALQSRLTGNDVRYFESYLQNGNPLEQYFVLRGDNTNVFTWRFQFGGNAIATTGQWINGGSDIRIKKDFKPIDDPRAKLRAIRAGTWKYDYEGAKGKFGIGVIANDIAEIYPSAVYHTGDRVLEDGTQVPDALSVEAGDSGVTPALHHANLLLLTDEVEELQQENDKLKAVIAELQARMKAIDGLDA